MKLKSNFSLDLDFKPLNLWPDTVPAIAIGNQLICGFHLNENHPVFEHSAQNFDANALLFKSIHPHLTLPEVARLTQSPVFSEYFQVDSFGFYSSPEILKILVTLSENFQNFVSHKKMGPQDLTPLLELNREQRDFVTDEILKSDESKQDSTKRLELLSDLILMGQKNLESLSLKSLIEKRYPVTTARDRSLQTAPLPWLSQVKSQFKRRGDKAGFDIQFFAGTPAELNKVAQNLTKVAESWNSKP